MNEKERKLDKRRKYKENIERKRRKAKVKAGKTIQQDI